jgi:5-methylcytosine-specific restriction endonuclease McrA
MTRKLQVLRELAFTRQDGKCWWCGELMLQRSAKMPANHPLLVTAEHLLQRARGGRVAVGNIAAAHAACNSRRHRRPTKRHHKPGEPSANKRSQ